MGKKLKEPIAAVLLAAGSSTRFGGNKLLQPLNGKPVYRYMLELLYEKQKERRIGRVLVVSQYDSIFADIREHFPGVEVVRNRRPQQGIAGSLRLGLARLLQQDGGLGACLFAVADQPGFSASSFEKMLDFWQANPYGIVAAGYRTKEGSRLQMKNPVIFSSAYFEKLLSLTGDVGGRQVIRAHLQDTGICEIPQAELQDLDTADAFLRLQFPFLCEAGHVIALVGAGGKTTLMDTFAACYAQRGSTAVLTTTTRIMRPKQYPVAYQMEQLREMLSGTQTAGAGQQEAGRAASAGAGQQKTGRIVAAGTDAPEGKLRMPDRISITDLAEAADVVFVEADGAKRLPCKAPREKEPVIPKECDIVVGVMGMDTLGQPLAQVCFCAEQVMQLLGVDKKHRMTEEDMARLLHSEQGTRKGVGNRDYYIVLNKCDDAQTMKRAQTVERLLRQAGEEHIACISLRNIQN